jgi:hypothetical protein
MVKKVENKRAGILCIDCHHFQITWEPSHPRACRAMGFKTKNWPCFEVLNTSGEPCMKFLKKNGKQEGNRKSGQGNEHFSLKV